MKSKRRISCPNLFILRIRNALHIQTQKIIQNGNARMNAEPAGCPKRNDIRQTRGVTDKRSALAKTDGDSMIIGTCSHQGRFPRNVTSDSARSAVHHNQYQSRSKTAQFKARPCISQPNYLSASQTSRLDNCTTPVNDSDSDAYAR